MPAIPVPTTMRSVRSSTASESARLSPGLSEKTPGKPRASASRASATTPALLPGWSLAKRYGFWNIGISQHRHSQTRVGSVIRSRQGLWRSRKEALDRCTSPRGSRSGYSPGGLRPSGEAPTLRYGKCPFISWSYLDAKAVALENRECSCIVTFAGHKEGGMRRGQFQPCHLG